MSTESKFRWHILTNFLRSEHRSVKSLPTSHRSWLGLSTRRIVFWTCAMLMTIGAGVYLRAEIHRRVARLDDHVPPSLTRTGGTLLIAGGGQLPDAIRLRFVELAGGSNAQIVVIPAEITDETTRDHYRETWERFGVKSVSVLQTDSRTAADDPDTSRMLETATGVWFGGGQQARLTGWYGNTLVETRVKEVLGRNGVIGGTSAGAAVMSGVMIASGRQTPTIGRGFDLIPNAVIDQHFVKRNRFNRLQYVIERHPDLVGLGIDEGTALEDGVESGHFRVLGQSCVVAFVSQTEKDAKSCLRLQFLNPGDEFDFDRLRRGEAVPAGYSDLEAVLFGE